MNSVFNILFDLEKELLTNTVRQSRDKLCELLAPDFYEIGTSGRTYNRDEVINFLLEDDPTPIYSKDFSSKALSDVIVLVSYKTSREKDFQSGSHRSSIWVKNDNMWQLKFHQGTKFK